MITLAELNRLDRAGSVAALDGLYEHSPWVADAAFAAAPFASKLALLDALNAAMLAAPAAAGWTPRDLTALVSDWLGAGHRIPDIPPRPIALLGTLLTWHTAHNTLAHRPAALDEAREAHERIARAARQSAREADHQAHRKGRAAGRAAATGPGRAAVFAELAYARHRAATRRTATAAAEHARVSAVIENARRDDQRTPDMSRWDLWR